MFFIGPESDHWLCLSLTHSLTDCRLVNLIDVTLSCEDGNSKLVEVVTFVKVDDEKQFITDLVALFRFRSQSSGEIWKLLGSGPDMAAELKDNILNF